MLSSVLVTSCAAQEEPAVSWQPVDYDKLQLEIDNPTASIGGNGVASLQNFTAATFHLKAQQLDQLFRYFGSVQSTFQKLNDAMKGSAAVDGDVSQVRQVSAGTLVKLKMSCADPDESNPNTHFEFGTIRIVDVTTALDEFIENGLPL